MPAGWKIRNCFIFNLGFVFLRSHFNVTNFGSGATRGASGYHKQLGSVNLNLMAARSQNPRNYRTGLYGLWWQFCEYLEDQHIVFFSGKFHHKFCHELLILKSKLRDLNSRLGSCGICASEIYFSNFFGNNKGKRLKWPSAWFCDSTKGSEATPYGARLLRTPYMIKILGLEHLIASKQTEVFWVLDVFEGRPRSNQKEALTTWSTRRRPAKDSTPAGLGYEELEGLSDPG